MNTPALLDPAHILSSAQRTFAIEVDALQALGGRLDQSFVEATQLLVHCQGRVVVTGIGKSGHVARKIAATLASTGTPAFFMHAAEALHGDLGMITKQDVVIAISYSGQAQELVTVLTVPGATSARAHMYVHVSPPSSLPALGPEGSSPNGPASAQPARLSATLTTRKNPSPVAVTDVVNVTSAPPGGTFAGSADFETLIPYVGGAAVASPTALSSSIPALNSAPNPRKTFIARVAPRSCEPEVALISRSQTSWAGPD